MLSHIFPLSWSAWQRWGGLLLLALCLMAGSAGATGLQVTDMSLRAEGESERITILLSEPASYRVFALENPPRLVLDLPPFQWRIASEDFNRYRGRLIQNLRYARFDATTSRLVLDLAGPVRYEYSGQGTREIQLLLKPDGYTPVAAASESAAPGKPFATVPLPTTKPAEPKPQKPLIVIDAGHGGQDPGTIGRRKTREKNVTLAYALALKKALIDSGQFRAELTREGDYFILLRERTRIAKRKGADLFLSLHADSAPGVKARGLSIYTLSEDASDAEAAALAAQENKVDILADVDLSHQDKDVAEILIDLAQRDTKNKSIALADHLMAALSGEVTLLPNTHRQAGFAVLKAPDIPAALIEIGFLSNPEEEHLLQTSSHREHVVQGITRGIENFFARRK